MTGSDNRLDTLIFDIREAFTRSGLSRRALAEAAGVHNNTLKDFKKSIWNPSYHTLRQLVDALRPWMDVGISVTSATKEPPDMTSECAIGQTDSHIMTALNGVAGV